MAHGIKIATFRDDEEVEEVFTSTTVRTRDTRFPLFGGAGTKPATETELQEFGDGVGARPDETKRPSHALHHPDVAFEEAEGILAPGGEMKRRQWSRRSDPEELRRRASATAAGARPTTMGGAGSASADPLRRITVKSPARPEKRRVEQQKGGCDDTDLEEPPTRRQRVARAVVQLRALVAITGKTDSDQCLGCNVAFDGGGFCACITELREQCVQDDVRLASYALTRTALVKRMKRTMWLLVTVWITEMMSSS